MTREPIDRSDGRDWPHTECYSRCVDCPLTRRRDRDSVRREHVIECLTGTYRELTAACAPNSSKNISSAHLTVLLGDLILLGDVDVVHIARDIRNVIENGEDELSLQKLLVHLRANIRGELGLPQDLDEWSPMLQVSFRERLERPGSVAHRAR